MAGCRLAHFQTRSDRPIRRARIGSPASQRSRSSASAYAERISPLRLLVEALQADRLQVAVDLSG